MSISVQVKNRSNGLIQCEVSGIITRNSAEDCKDAFEFQERVNHRRAATTAMHVLLGVANSPRPAQPADSGQGGS